MSHATFDDPGLTTFCGLDELGLRAVGQHLEPDRAVLECRVAEADPWCLRRGSEGVGVVRDTVVRRLAHNPLGWRPTVLLIQVRRYDCTGTGRM